MTKFEQNRKQLHFDAVFQKAEAFELSVLSVFRFRKENQKKYYHMTFDGQLLKEALMVKYLEWILKKKCYKLQYLLYPRVRVLK